MNIIDKLNSAYTIKFTDKYDLLNRGDRQYFIVNTFDDKKYLFKSYKRNTNNITKLKDANDVSHLVSKQLFLFADYIFSKEYDPIVELDEGNIGTLFSHSEGEFLMPSNITPEHFQKLASFSYDFHKIGYDLYDQSFTIKQIENVGSILRRNSDKIRSELDEDGTHYMLENKFGVKLDLDMLNLNLSHVENIVERLKLSKPTILNMDANFENITFSKDESGKLVISNVVLDRVLTGHPCFEIGKTISRLMIHLNLNSTQELKKIFTDKAEDKTLLREEVIDTLVDFYLINMFYKFVRNEAYRDQEERFELLKNKLIKRKVLTFV